METWKDVYGFEGKYQVSNYGRIKSLKRKGIPKDRVMNGYPIGTHRQYHAITLSDNKYIEKWLVHRLVATHFIRPGRKDEVVNHIDFNPSNNNVANLEWCTHSENSQHSSKNSSLSKQGEKHPASKISDADALEIKRLRKKKVRSKVIAKRFGITEWHVNAIFNSTYKHLNHLV